jgi:hypothetical protein
VPGEVGLSPYITHDCSAMYSILFVLLLSTLSEDDLHDRNDDGHDL